MSTKKAGYISLLIILLSFAIGAYYYPQMPLMVASHWGANGEVNGYMSRFWGVFLMPVISVGLFLLLMIVPKIDPKKANISKFKSYFNGFIVTFFVFFFYLHLLTIVWNLGSHFNMTQYLAPAFAVFFFYVGLLVENSEPNWTIGIRTPWTLSSEDVWRKTHKLGGKLFKYSAVIGLLGVIGGQYAFYFVIMPILFTAIYATVYSYFEYKKVNK